MEETRFLIRPKLRTQDYEDLTTLHEKQGKGTMHRVNRVSNILLVVLAVIMPLDALVMILLQHRVSGSSVLALVVGLVAILYLCLRRKLAARIMAGQNEKIAGNLEVVVDDEGIHARNASIESNYAFSAVEEIYCWRSCYYLYLDKVRVQPLPFRDFVEGDPAHLGVWLEEKTGLHVQTIPDKKKER